MGQTGRMRQASPAPDLEFESRFHRQGLALVAGVDEVGRGCLAGPVAAGAVILPQSPIPELFAVVRDSKRLSAKQREVAYEIIARCATSYAVGWATPAEIDDVGIAAAVRRAMRRALAKLSPPPDALLIDAVSLPSVDLPQKAIIRGDSKSLSIAAASIVGKVERDGLMSKLAESFTEYGFERHKGYGTARHLGAIRRLGPTRLHRMSFNPMRDSGRGVAAPAAASEIGREAESLAALALQERGMRIVARNFRSRHGEVDLAALLGDTLVFVEVRALRSTKFATPAETVSAAKARRLALTCQQFLQDTSLAWRDWRIDVAEVRLDRWRRPYRVSFVESAVEEW